MLFVFVVQFSELLTGLEGLRDIVESLLESTKQVLPLDNHD
jgi:hypothetical protein